MSAKAILFLRVSTASQLTEQQIKRVKDRAISDHFSENDIVVIDKVESGIKLDEQERESIQELFNYIDNGVDGGKVDTVYTFELSRIARRADVLYAVRKKLTDNKVQLVCCEPPFILLKDDRSSISETANILFALMSAMAEQEMEIKKARFAKARELKAERGEYIGGNIPIGYRKDGKGGKIVIDEEGARMVRMIFDWYENGKTQPQIARELQGEFPNRKFMLSFVSQVLRNELYVGIVREAGTECINSDGEVYRKYVYKKQLPQIISREQFDRCREIAKKNFHKRRASKYVYYAYHKIICPRCGGTWGVGNQRGAYYCRNAYNTQRDISNFGPIDCDYKHSIGVNIMDSFLWHLATILQAKYNIEDDKEKIKLNNQQIRNIQKQITILERENAEYNKTVERASEMYVEGMWSKEKYNSKVSVINAAISKNKNDIVEYCNQINKKQKEIEELTNKGLLKSGGRVVIKLKDIGSETERIRAEYTTDKERFDIVQDQISQVIVNVEESGEYLIGDKVVTAMIKEFVIESKYYGTMKFYYVPHYNKMFDRHPSKKDKVLIDFIRYNRFGETAKRKRKERYAEKSKEFWSQFDGYYTTRQAADLLGISYREAYRLDTTYGIAKEYCDHALRGGKHKGKFVMYKKEDIEKIKAQESVRNGRLTSVEIRKKYKIEYNELLQIVNKGEVKADKIRNRLYIDEEDVKKYLQTKKRKGKQK